MIKVGDFGLVTALSAAPAENSESLSQVNNIISSRYLENSVVLTGNVGTQLYMSPEQVYCEIIEWEFSKLYVFDDHLQ